MPLQEEPSENTITTRSEISLGSQNRIYTVTQVASLLEVSGMTVYRLIKTGELSAVQFGKSMKISQGALSDFIRRSALPQSDPEIAIKGILSDLD